MSFFSLFGSVTTLFCCALPVTLVSIGMGATFASLTSTFPQIIWLTENKGYLFFFTGALLILSFIMMRYSKTQSCPIDIDQRAACQSSKGISNKLYCFTVLLYFVGLIFSYVLPIFF